MRKTIDIINPSTNWVITHNLNKHVTTDVFVMRDGSLTKILPNSVEYLNLQQVRITFTAPEIGKVIIAS